MTPFRSDPAPSDAMGREDDVVGGEILTFVELHALAQMKAPVQRIKDLPARREAGLQRQVRPKPNEPFIDRPVDAEAEALVDLVRVDRLQFALKGEAQGLGFGAGRERGN